MAMMRDTAYPKGAFFGQNATLAYEEGAAIATRSRLESAEKSAD